MPGAYSQGNESDDDTDNDVPASDADLSDPGTASTYEDCAGVGLLLGQGDPGLILQGQYVTGRAGGGYGNRDAPAYAKRSRDEQFEIPIEGALPPAHAACSVVLGCCSPQHKTTSRLAPDGCVRRRDRRAPSTFLDRLRCGAFTQTTTRAGKQDGNAPIKKAMSAPYALKTTMDHHAFRLC